MFMSNINSLSSYLPELMVVVTILAVILMESISKYRSLTFITTVVGLVFSGILLFIASSVDVALFQGMIVHDSFSLYFKWFILFSTLSIVLVSKDDNSVMDSVKGEYYAILLIIMIGMFTMVSARK